SPPYSSPLPPPAPTPLPTLSLHDALPISHHPEPIVDHGVLPLHPIQPNRFQPDVGGVRAPAHRHEDLVGLDLPSVLERRRDGSRSEEHTSELQSRFDLVCRLLLEKKNPPFSPWQERELEEQAWQAVHKHYPDTIKKLEDKGGAFLKAAQDLGWSAAKVKKYYYKRN